MEELINKTPKPPAWRHPSTQATPPPPAWVPQPRPAYRPAPSTVPLVSFNARRATTRLLAFVLLGALVLVGLLGAVAVSVAAGPLAGMAAVVTVLALAGTALVRLLTLRW